MTMQDDIKHALFAAGHPYWQGFRPSASEEPVDLYTTEQVRAAVLADREYRQSADAHFDLWQDDMVVASATGPREQALAEIQHYAAVYGQDGPVQIEEVIRIPVSAAIDACHQQSATPDKHPISPMTNMDS